MKAFPMKLNLLSSNSLQAVLTSVQAALFLACSASAAPVVFWSSDPIRPGDTAMLIGEDFSTNAVVEVVRLADLPAVQPAIGNFVWPGSGTPVALDQFRQL